MTPEQSNLYLLAEHPFEDCVKSGTQERRPSTSLLNIRKLCIFYVMKCVTVQQEYKVDTYLLLLTINYNYFITEY